MRIFIFKILSFSLLLAGLVVAGLFLPDTPRVKDSLLGAKAFKDSLLANTPSPRIVFIGGSNLSFGLNSGIIKDSLGLNPVNTAICAGYGMKYMLDNSLQYIKANDIVVASFEYFHFYGDYCYGRNELLVAVAGDGLRGFKELSFQQYKNIIKYVPKYALSKFNPMEYWAYNIKDVYSEKSFNEYGDAYLHWNKKKERYIPVSTIDSKFNPMAIRCLNDYRDKLKKKNVRLFVTFPSLQRTALLKNKSAIEKVERELKKINFELLGTPLRYSFADSLYFNSEYHLLKKAVDIRTEFLIEDLKNKL